MIDGVRVKRLKVIPDERGMLMEMLRDDDEFFQRFGQVFSRDVGWASPVRASERKGETQGNRGPYPSRPESSLAYSPWDSNPFHD